MNVYSFLAGKLAGVVPTIHNVHGTGIRRHSILRRRLIIGRVMAGQALRVVSEELKERMKNLGVREQSMQVILNGIALRHRDLFPVRFVRKAGVGLHPRDLLIA
jgi:hypothetical protein